jgi:hypothetical protein
MNDKLRQDAHEGEAATKCQRQILVAVVIGAFIAMAAWRVAVHMGFIPA